MYMKRLALALCVVALVSCKRAADDAPAATDTTSVPAAPVDSAKMMDTTKAMTDTAKAH
jgi:hypothetical protein